MDAVKGFLATAAGVLGPILKTTGNIFSVAGDVLTKLGSTIFVLGFIGILFTFLWFLFRYLDKKQLTLPTVVFVFFFIVFLSGNLLIIAQDAKVKDAEKVIVVEAQVPEAIPDGNTSV